MAAAAASRPLAALVAPSSFRGATAGDGRAATAHRRRSAGDDDGGTTTHSRLARAAAAPAEESKRAIIYILLPFSFLGRVRTILFCVAPGGAARPGLDVVVVVLGHKNFT
jgi:hypothetical protein